MMVLENHSTAAAPAAYSTTPVLFSTLSHCGYRQRKEAGPSEDSEDQRTWPQTNSNKPRLRGRQNKLKQTLAERSFMICSVSIWDDSASARGTNLACTKHPTCIEEHDPLWVTTVL